MEIIGLSGRIKSGKGYASDFFVSKGYKKITIASVLKDAIAKLYDLDISYCYDQDLKVKILNLPWNKTKASELASILDINASDVWVDGDSLKILRDVRTALQFIGTEVLRRVSENFHIERTIKNLDSNGKYVCDDVRFPNEKRALEDIGARCLFIIRPLNPVIYNHSSEISLNWSNYENVIINNKDLDYFDDKLSEFERTGSCTNEKYDDINHRAMLDIDKESAYFAGLLSSICSFNSGLIEFSHPYYFVISHLKKYFNIKSEIVKRRESFYISCKSPFIIENLKMWNVTGNGKVNIPEILKDSELIDSWFYGYLGGIQSFVTNEFIVCKGPSNIISWLGNNYKNLNPIIIDNELTVKNMFLDRAVMFR